MSELDLESLVNELSLLYPEEHPSDFSNSSFQILAIVGHRDGCGTRSEYKLRWRPSRLTTRHLLTGFVDGRPLRDDIDKVMQEVDRQDRVRVIWRDTWVPAENVVHCGDLLHEFWTMMFQDGCGTRTSIVDGMLVRDTQAQGE